MMISAWHFRMTKIERCSLLRAMPTCDTTSFLHASMHYHMSELCSYDLPNLNSVAFCSASSDTLAALVPQLQWLSVHVDSQHKEPPDSVIPMIEALPAAKSIEGERHMAGQS
jgi:hypothetical protein